MRPNVRKQEDKLLKDWWDEEEQDAKDIAEDYADEAVQLIDEATNEAFKQMLDQVRKWTLG